MNTGLNTSDLDVQDQVVNFLMKRKFRWENTDFEGDVIMKKTHMQTHVSYATVDKLGNVNGMPLADYLETIE